MLRAEEKARSGNQPTEQRPWASKTTGRLIARCGIEAVNATERVICETGAVHGAAVAEGLALGGKRAATLLEDAPSARDAGAGFAGAGAWVHHRVRPGQSAPAGLGFELVAGNVQEAVDQCLVAHRLAVSSGSPGMCTLDRDLARGTHLVRLPEPKQVEKLLAETAGRGENEATLLDSAADAFDAVARTTGRPCAAVSVHAAEGAEVALVGCGATAAWATVLADRLRAAGVPGAALNVALLRPFPTDELRQALDGVGRVVVLESAGDPSERGRLTDLVRAALDRSVPGRPVAVETDGRPDAEIASAVAAALGLSPDQETLLAAPDEAGEAPAVTLAVAPAGDWSLGFLLDAAGLVGSVRELTLECPEQSSLGASMLSLGRLTAGPEDARRLDLLFATDPALLDSHPRLLESVRDAGTVLVHSPAGSPEAAALSIGETRRQEMASRGIRLRWVDSSVLDARAEFPQDQRIQLLGAFLTAEESIARLAGTDGDLMAAIGSSAELTGSSAEFAALLGEGAAALRQLEPAGLDRAKLAEQTDFLPSSELPVMPPRPEGDAVPAWSGAVHEFHLTGHGAHSKHDPIPALPLRPAVLAPLADPDRVWRDYPFVLLPDGAPQSLSALVSDRLDAIESAGAEVKILRDGLARLSRAASGVLERHGGAGELRAVMAEALPRFAGEFDLSESGTAELNEQIARLEERLPEHAELIGIERRTLLRFYTAGLRAERGPRRFAFLEEAKRLAHRMEELLQIETSHTPEGISPQALAAELGDSSAMRIDPAALSRNLPQQRGAKRMSPQRKQRVEHTLATLRDYLGRAGSEPECVVVHPRLLDDDNPLPAARAIDHPEALEMAIGLFDGLADRMTEVIRAVRIARLEGEGAYDPELHDAVLTRFDWQAFTADELLVLPPVIVLETAERLRGSSLAAFSTVLRSGRPLQVLVMEVGPDVRAGDTWEALTGYHPGLGYLAVAHREAFVLQSTLAHPERLAQSLREMTRSLSPAVALVAVPAWSSPVHPWLQLAASHYGRGVPLFRYDPDAGSSWAERFDLSENPHPELAWPVPEVEFTDDGGEAGSLGEAFTFAHAAATDPVYRLHFRVIPPEAWHEDQLPVADYLALAAGERLHRVPFVWVVREDGALARAVMTRELAFACRDRARAWRILQELGGEDNEYAVRAAEAARGQALAEAEEAKQLLLSEHADELQRVRTAAASDAMERLVAVLMSEDAIAALSGAAPMAAPAVEPAEAAPAPEPAVEAPPAEAEEEEEEISFGEPYIDSMLCTSCNDCININAQMFGYNANKQAILVDAGAGNFEQLVKAAEKCPARCIHPGAPRPDDDTATEELVARAAKFN